MNVENIENLVDFNFLRLWINPDIFINVKSCLRLRIFFLQQKTAKKSLILKGLWSGNFFFVKSWAIVPWWTSKTNFWAWDLFKVDFEHFIFFRGPVIVYRGLVIYTADSYMTDHAGPRRYECNPVFQIGTRGICNLVLKLHNPMKNCGTRW